MSTKVLDVSPEKRMTREAAAEYLGYAVQTLAEWQSTGRHRIGRKAGKKVYYYKEDLDRFLRTGKSIDEPDEDD